MRGHLFGLHMLALSCETIAVKNFVQQIVVVVLLFRFVMGECDQQKIDFVFEALGGPDPFERKVAIDLDLAEAERWKAERSDEAPVLSLRVL